MQPAGPAIPIAGFISRQPAYLPAGLWSFLLSGTDELGNIGVLSESITIPWRGQTEKVIDHTWKSPWKDPPIAFMVTPDTALCLPSTPCGPVAQGIPWATFALEEVNYNVDEKSP